MQDPAWPEPGSRVPQVPHKWMESKTAQEFGLPNWFGGFSTQINNQEAQIHAGKHPPDGAPRLHSPGSCQGCQG